MAQGFQGVQNSLKETLQSYFDQKEDEIDEDMDYEEEVDNRSVAPDNGETDMFQSIVKDFISSDTVGPDVLQSLAALVDKFIKKRANESIIKTKHESYLRPKNTEFLEAPKINRPVWENLSPPTKMHDAGLQSVQRDFLTSAVPVLKVMEKLHEAREDASKLNIEELVTMLSDSLLFLGSANVGMVKKRRDLLKKDLPSNMIGLCRERRVYPFRDLIYSGII